MYQEASLAQQWVWGVVQTIYTPPEMLQWQCTMASATRIIFLAIYYIILFCLPEEQRVETHCSFF